MNSRDALQMLINIRSSNYKLKDVKILKIQDNEKKKRPKGF